jgi:hypothetical protein
MAAFTTQRLQTNASWAAKFTFTGIDITSWVLSGRAQSSVNSSKHVDLSITGGQITIDNATAGTFSIRLSPTESAQLGEGTISFEVMRDTPTPRRPVLRFSIKSHPGIAV